MRSDRRRILAPRRGNAVARAPRRSDAVPRAAAAARRWRWNRHAVAARSGATAADRRIRRDARRVSRGASLRLLGRLEQELQGHSTNRCSTRRDAPVERGAGTNPTSCPAEDLTTQAGLAVQQDLALAGCSASHTSSAMAITTSTDSPAKARRRRAAAFPGRTPRPLLSDDGSVRLAIRDGMIDLALARRRRIRVAAPSRTGSSLDAAVSRPRRKEADCCNDACARRASHPRTARRRHPRVNASH